MIYWKHWLGLMSLVTGIFVGGELIFFFLGVSEVPEVTERQLWWLLLFSLAWGWGNIFLSLPLRQIIRSLYKWPDRRNDWWWSLAGVLVAVILVIGLPNWMGSHYLLGQWFFSSTLIFSIILAIVWGTFNFRLQPRRIWVIGVDGAGKSAWVKSVFNCIGITHVASNNSDNPCTHYYSSVVVVSVVPEETLRSSMDLHSAKKTRPGAPLDALILIDRMQLPEKFNENDKYALSTDSLANFFKLLDAKWGEIPTFLVITHLDRIIGFDVVMSALSNKNIPFGMRLPTQKMDDTARCAFIIEIQQVLQRAVALHPDWLAPDGEQRQLTCPESAKRYLHALAFVREVTGSVLPEVLLRWQSLYQPDSGPSLKGVYLVSNRTTLLPPRMTMVRELEEKYGLISPYQPGIPAIAESNKSHFVSSSFHDILEQIRRVPRRKPMRNKADVSFPSRKLALIGGSVLAASLVAVIFWPRPAPRVEFTHEGRIIDGADLGWSVGVNWFSGDQPVMAIRVNGESVDVSSRILETRSLMLPAPVSGPVTVEIGVPRFVFLTSWSRHDLSVNPMEIEAVEVIPAVAISQSGIFEIPCDQETRLRVSARNARTQQLVQVDPVNGSTKQIDVPESGIVSLELLPRPLTYRYEVWGWDTAAPSVTRELRIGLSPPVLRSALVSDKSSVDTGGTLKLDWKVEHTCGLRLFVRRTDRTVPEIIDVTGRGSFVYHAQGVPVEQDLVFELWARTVLPNHFEKLSDPLRVFITPAGFACVEAEGIPAFYIQRHETTNEEFKVFYEGRLPGRKECKIFLRDMGASIVGEEAMRPFEGASLPVVCMTPEEAEGYADFMSKRSDRDSCYTAGREQHNCNGFRLPTKREWLAAKGASRFPWGESQPTCETMVFARWKGGCGKNGPEEVMRYRDDFSALGVFDLGGNVSELIKDDPEIQFGESYPYFKIGASWSTGLDKLEASFKPSLLFDPSGDTYRSSLLGFRLVRSATRCAPTNSLSN